MQARAHLAEQGLAEGPLRDAIVSCLYKKAEAVCRDVVRLEEPKYNEKQLKIDRILTSKWTGIPIMLALLAAVFWITITGANYPFRAVEPWFVLGTGPPDGSVCVPSCAGLAAWGAGAGRIPGAGVGGIGNVARPWPSFFRSLPCWRIWAICPGWRSTWISIFKKCRACGKQALTMCMGFGCNAAGIVGCRIIDSPRERLIAILTNNFVPCNGRFPTFCQRAKRKMGLCIAKTCSR